MELDIRVSILEDEIKNLSQHLYNSIQPQSVMYNQILEKYKEPLINNETKIVHNDVSYIVDKNILWDKDGYICGIIKNNIIVLNTDKE
jgi:hypothetical protein